jgi:hypothetical protein
MRHRSSSAVHQETNVARLTRELHEALEQQTATAEVLKVTSGSASSNATGQLPLVAAFEKPESANWRAKARNWRILAKIGL